MNTNKFIVSNKQVELDQKMVLYDLWATKAHVLMLAKQKIIEAVKAKNIIKALEDIDKEYQKGEFTIDPDRGLHLTIEAKVIEKIGEDGYFMHTARSRNDQVMTMELLYLREEVLEVLSKLLRLLKLLIDRAEKNIETVMSGYTHMQPAKPTTFGQWCLSYFDMMLLCFKTLEHAYHKYNLCPLGAVESYGTSWKIDRRYTAELLGFTKVWEIPQSAISSRGFAQLAYLGGLEEIAMVVSKIASDLLLFTTFEFGYVKLSEDVAQQMGSVTGSSIMPQKKNPDVLELLRSISPQIIGYQSIVANLISGLPMGYNRDIREVKEYIGLGLEKTQNALNSLAVVLENMIVDKNKMLKSVVDNYSMSTDLADCIAQKTGLPYRKVYKLVGFIVKEKIKNEIPLSSLTINELKKTADYLGLNLTFTQEDLKTALDPVKALSKRKHLGGASPKVMKKMIEKRKELLTVQELWIKSACRKIDISKNTTQQEIENLWKV